MTYRRRKVLKEFEALFTFFTVVSSYSKTAPPQTCCIFNSRLLLQWWIWRCILTDFFQDGIWSLFNSSIWFIYQYCFLTTVRSLFYFYWRSLAKQMQIYKHPLKEQIRRCPNTYKALWKPTNQDLSAASLAAWHNILDEQNVSVKLVCLYPNLWTYQ